LLASDRRLTFGEGPRVGEIYDDDTCKLVSLCGTTGIAYTGLGKIENASTHEWVAKTLAAAGCRDGAHAARIIENRATTAFSTVRKSVRRHTFFLAGWAMFGSPAALNPYNCIISNMYDASEQNASKPLDSFSSFFRVLEKNEQSYGHLLGESLSKERAEQLSRNVRRLAERRIGSQETLRLLSDEIVHTSGICTTVGSKILGFCIPRESVLKQFETGQSVMVATQPNPSVATFTYFEKGFNELQQYGPTVCCGESAYTDLKTENDPSRDFKRSEFRILALPKPKPSGQ
jgi:hypothetical protein